MNLIILASGSGVDYFKNFVRLTLELLRRWGNYQIELVAPPTWGSSFQW